MSLELLLLIFYIVICHISLFIKSQQCDIVCMSVVIVSTMMRLLELISYQVTTTSRAVAVASTQPVNNSGTSGNVALPRILAL